MPDSQPPVTLVIAGHDPSGGAGIQADIETIQALGAFPATVITTLTVQDSHNIRDIYPVPADLIRRQAETLFNDYPITAIKIGLLGSAENAHAVADLLTRVAQIPVVLDTVLAAGGGTDLSSRQLQEAMMQRLIPLARLTTPNSVEARRLTSEAHLDECASTLLCAGAGSVLITGEHEQNKQVINTLYRTGHPPLSRAWPRLPDRYHGSGCTLAAACAALLAQGMELQEAVLQAQQFTWEALRTSHRLGQGQRIPNRLHRSLG